MKTIATALLSLSIAVFATIGSAQTAEETLLTVTQDDAVTEYDLEALEAMGPVTFETTTIWTEGEQSFTGVPLQTFIAEMGFEAGTIFASAINDYTVEIPVTDAVEGGPIIAYLNNGEKMSVRDKGPLWVVYPYDSNTDYQSEVIYSRSIWQLDRIEVKN